MLIVKLPAIDAFVSGHTHAPGLRVVRRVDGEQAVAVNCGCWLREFTPVHTRFKGPPGFRLEVRAHPRKDTPEGRRAARGALGASEARRSTPHEGRDAGEPGQDTPPNPPPTPNRA